MRSGFHFKATYFISLPVMTLQGHLAKFRNSVLRVKWGWYLHCNKKTNKSLECSKKLLHTYLGPWYIHMSPDFICTIILFCRHFHYLVLLMRNLGLKKDNPCAQDLKTRRVWPIDAIACLTPCLNCCSKNS